MSKPIYTWQTERHKKDQESKIITVTNWRYSEKLTSQREIVGHYEKEKTKWNGFGLPII